MGKRDPTLKGAHRLSCYRTQGEEAIIRKEPGSDPQAEVGESLGVGSFSRGSP